MKVGDKIKNKRSGVILQIIKIGNPTLTCKVIDIGDGSVSNLHIGKIEKTSSKLIGVIYDQIQENKMKLTTEQKAKVIKFAKSLVVNENTSTLKLNLTKDQEFADIGKFLTSAGIRYAWSAEQGTLIFNNSLDRKNAAVLLRQSEFSNLMAESKILKENNTYTMISALREIADDLLLSTELLIDNNYGKMDHKEFKDAWYKSSNEFEKKFRNIIKNLMRAGK